MFRSRLWVYFVVAVIALSFVVPNAALAAPATSTAASNTVKAGAAPQQHWDGCWYKVHWGDTLGDIAWHHWTTAWYLARLNHLHRPDKIYAGQWLKVPCARRYHRSHKW